MKRQKREIKQHIESTTIHLKMVTADAHYHFSLTLTSKMNGMGQNETWEIV